MTLKTRATAVAAAMTLTVGGLSGCQWLVEQTTPSFPPQTKPTSTASAETAQERQMRLDQEAAVRAYQTADKESARLAMAGGASKPTKVLLATTGGDYLEVQMGDLTYLRKHGWHADRPIRSSVVANGGWSPTKIGLTACEDTSKVRLLNKKGAEVAKDRPRHLVQTLTATKVAGVWKITDLETKTVKGFESESGCQQV